MIVDCYSRRTATSNIANTTFDYGCGGCPLRLTDVRHYRQGGTGGPIGPFDSITFIRDQLGKITEMTDSDGLHTYRHDRLRRIIAADHNNVVQPNDVLYLWRRRQPPPQPHRLAFS